MLSDQEYDEMMLQVKLRAKKIFQEYRKMKLRGREYLSEEVVNGEKVYSEEGRYVGESGESAAIAD